MATGFEIRCSGDMPWVHPRLIPRATSRIQSPPRAIGSGLGALSTYLEILGFIAELSFMLWLLIKGVNGQRWSEFAAHTPVRADGGNRGRLAPAVTFPARVLKANLVEARRCEAVNLMAAMVVAAGAQ